MPTDRPATSPLPAILHMAENISRAGHGHLAPAQRGDRFHYEWEKPQSGGLRAFFPERPPYHEIHADILEHLRENA